MSLIPKLNPRSRATGRITLADVARLAQVSPITVSRALRGERAVDAELVARVQTAVQQLGYLPDPAARALASRHSSQIVVLVPMLSNALFVDLLEAVQRKLHSAGFQMLMGITHYDPLEEEALLRQLLLHRPAGVLVTGFERTDAARKLIAQSRIPCVHLMEAHGDEGVYSVGFSQKDAGAEMTRHLLGRGYRRIAFVGAQLDPRTMQRLEGWRSALQDSACYQKDLEWLNPQPSSMALGAAVFQQIVQTQPDVDAVFFCNDDLAQGALLAATRMGIKIPERLAIAGFNDLTGSDQMVPALTTVRTPRAEIGTVAASMLLNLIKGAAVASTCVDLGYALQVRESS
jgi:LacI family gluconate utilization system Gnt-I transcriptional repressor